MNQTPAARSGVPQPKDRRMLVLTRREGQTIVINGNIKVHVVKSGRQVRVGVEAPKNVTVLRDELEEREGEAA